MMDITPNTNVLIKLGSLFVHVEEAISTKAHSFDILAIKQILEDDDVKAWIEKMDNLALVPKKR